MHYMTNDQHALIQSAPGWCAKDKREAVFEHLRRLASTRIVFGAEIGVFGGQSLLVAGFALQAANNGGTITGVDPYEALPPAPPNPNGSPSDYTAAWWQASGASPDDTKHMAQAAIAKAGLMNYVKILRKRSLCAVDGFEEASLSYLHIDGLHGDKDALADWLAYRPKLRRGALVVVDDTDLCGEMPILRSVGETCRQLLGAYNAEIGSCWRLYEVL